MPPEEPKTSAEVRTPMQVIDAAIRENTKWDWARYTMALSFTVTALGALVWGVWYNQGWPGWPVASGATSTGGAWVMIRHLSAIWKANTSLRMIELTLSDRRTARGALEDLRKIYLESFGKGK
ncbi:MAG: hypothetical protein J0I06_15110 [Planctomycetes bacterium]|nr:hypothetical protein [Planctomycetota bacterium]